MTYTFKLARRLAVSRHFSMLPVLLLSAACLGGDATAPEGSPPTSGSQWRPRDIIPVAVQVEPSSVTLETNQLIHFRALARTSAGDSVSAAVTWSTTGGTILPDGRFSAAAIGTYKVIGRNRARGEVHVDTSIVLVVRRQPKLASVEINPVSSSLPARSKQKFNAVGHLSNGTAVPIGANWLATGGAVDAAGSYTAGDSAGTFQVIATNTAGTLADTAQITITALPDSTPPPPTEPPPGPPPPPPPPPPTPALQQVTLVPATATLASATKRQFAAFGRTTAGDSVAVDVVFTATGGTVTSGGLFTAGTQAGTFRVVATAGALADTSTVTVTVPLGSGRSGIGLGASHVPMDSLGSLNIGYNATIRTVWPPSIKSELDIAQARHGFVVLAIDRTKTKDASGKLSVAATKAELANWRAAIDLTPYIADGTVVGVMVTDDITYAPQWGGEVPPKARIDSLGLAVKDIWPQAHTIVRAKPTLLTGYSWRWITTAWAQYEGPYRESSPESFRSVEVATAKSLKMGLVLWLNVLDGGCGLTSACPAGVTGTNILGTYQDAANVRRFQMSAAEVEYYGKIFLQEPYNCLAIQWQWSPVYKASLPADQLAGIRAFDTRPDIRAAFGTLSILAAQHASTSCQQP